MSRISFLTSLFLVSSFPFFCMNSPLILAESNGDSSNSSNLESQGNNDLYDGDCESRCENVLGDPNVDKNSQLYLQCVTVKQTSASQTLDVILLGIDAATLAACSAACITPTSPLAISCDALNILSGATELSSTIIMAIMFDKSLGTSDYLSIAMGAVGVGMGAHGLYRSLK